MKSHATARFWAAYRALQPPDQQRARAAYRLFRQNPLHPSLHFRQVHPTRPIYSARISRSHRALGVRDGDTIIWFWIGSHEEYERLSARS